MPKLIKGKKKEEFKVGEVAIIDSFYAITGKGSICRNSDTGRIYVFALKQEAKECIKLLDTKKYKLSIKRILITILPD